jgi:cell division protein FtsZ
MAPNAVIKVIGVGGGGGNAVAHMVNSSVQGVEFICANTDAQAIKNVQRESDPAAGWQRHQGPGRGRESGSRPPGRAGRPRAHREALEGADMVFITAGMGGGTGTGAAPVVAQLAKEMGILTVAVVTKPFPFEGRRAHAGRAQGHRGAVAPLRFADHHPEREADHRARAATPP